MRVRNAHQIEHALNAAIFARNTMKRVENDVGRSLGELCRDIAAHIDGGDAVALHLESIAHAAAGHEAHLTLIRPAAH